MSVFLEDVLSFGAPMKFTSLIKNDKAFSALNRLMGGQELVNELQRWSLGDSDICMDNLTEGVLYHEPTGFTIDSNNIFPPGSVLGYYTCKGEIHGDALIGYSGFGNRISTRADSFELGFDAGGALI